MRKLKLIGSALTALALGSTLSLDAAAQKGTNAPRGRRPGPRTATAARAEPAYTLTGRMTGNKILARTSTDRPSFELSITGAQVVDGKLQFQGMLSPVSATGSKATAAAGSPMNITATLVGTMARASNPWPSANEGAPARRRAAAAATTTGGAAAAAGPGAAAQPQGREARTPETASEMGQLAQTTQSTQAPNPTPTAPQGRRPAGGEVNEQTQSLYAAIDNGSGCEVMFFKVALPPQIAAAAHARQPVQLGVVLAPMDNQHGEQINNHLCRILRAVNSKQNQQGLQTELSQLNTLLAEGSRRSAAGHGGH